MTQSELFSKKLLADLKQFFCDYIKDDKFNRARDLSGSIYKGKLRFYLKFKAEGTWLLTPSPKPGEEVGTFPPKTKFPLVS